MTAVEFGTDLKILRKTISLSQEIVCRDNKLSRVFLANLENGRIVAPFKNEKAINLCKYYSNILDDRNAIKPQWLTSIIESQDFNLNKDEEMIEVEHIKLQYIFNKLRSIEKDIDELKNMLQLI